VHLGSAPHVEGLGLEVKDFRGLRFRVHDGTSAAPSTHAISAASAAVALSRIEPEDVEFRVMGLGFRVYESRFRVWRSEFRIGV